MRSGSIRKLYITIVTLVLGLIPSGIALASAAAEGGHEVDKVAMQYYQIQWGLTIATFVICLLYALKIKLRGKGHSEGMLLGFLIVIMVFAIKGLDYPLMLRSFHETQQLGTIRIFVMFVAAFLITFYGVLGRHDEEPGDHGSDHGHGSGHGEDHGAAPDAGHH
ncbi:MAG: hypothetical protein QMD53_03480 [Actinomycetota bacterium]|nr:hypothetical protein [Actinomycetota bacterium]MDI6799718.1 hypothetical protein [Actinomycetota bacterium]